MLQTVRFRKIPRLPLVARDDKSGGLWCKQQCGSTILVMMRQTLCLIGLLAVGKLPYGKFGIHDTAYSERFSAEEFGLVVECADRDVAEVDALMRAHSAKEVNLVEA